MMDLGAQRKPIAGVRFGVDQPKRRGLPGATAHIARNPVSVFFYPNHRGGYWLQPHEFYGELYRDWLAAEDRA